eukprot:CAMPEP_0196581308 /NCGR_PEP_ID=MMETSP1081-20130531/33571_1 /TAXON_ID=36882 /ORGANISM="Pyramimonas amylifera, Strain CCMP720" /LENGTH=106 /DNA_ID=CAMNT_0041901499 /DNA_START=257 /DNA_END=577 /DNA_ORIENTATION=+
MARKKAQEKLEGANKGSQAKTNSAAMSIKCNVCMQTFMCTSTEAKLKEHSENKHPKEDFFRCFPCQTPEAKAAEITKADADAAAAAKAKLDAPKEKKKDKVYKGSK